MSCEVAALSFQAHANYGTWSKDFANDLVQETPEVQIKNFENSFLCFVNLKRLIEQEQLFIICTLFTLLNLNRLPYMNSNVLG